MVQIITYVAVEEGMVPKEEQTKTGQVDSQYIIRGF